MTLGDSYLSFLTESWSQQHQMGRSLTSRRYWWRHPISKRKTAAILGFWIANINPTQREGLGNEESFQDAEFTCRSRKHMRKGKWGHWKEILLDSPQNMWFTPTQSLISPNQFHQGQETLLYNWFTKPAELPELILQIKRKERKKPN